MAGNLCQQFEKTLEIVSERINSAAEAWNNETLTTHGSQIDQIRSFRDRKGCEFKASAIVVDFSGILHSKTAVDIIKGVHNKDLLHAVVALYDVSLSEMTPDVLYGSVCGKWARTVILLKDVNDTLRDMKSRSKTKKTINTESNQRTDDLSNENNVNSKSELNISDRVSINPLENPAKEIETEDKYEPNESVPCTFCDVFSDSDTDDESVEEEEEEEEDFSKGMNSFLETVKARRRLRAEQDDLTLQDVAIENRIIAAATFEKTYIKPSERVVHLTLIAVRKRHRKCEIGKYLLSQIKNSSVVGRYDAVVVHADNSAVSFFKKYGFSDDVVLNSRWSELAEQYTQCTLISYLPPFTSDCNVDLMPVLDLVMMESDIDKWKIKSLEAYQAQVSCFSRLRHEILHLRTLLMSQQDLISVLTSTNEKLQHEKFALEKDFLEYRLLATRSALLVDDHSSDFDTDDSDLENILKALPSKNIKDQLPGRKIQLDQRALCVKCYKMKEDDKREVSTTSKEFITDFHPVICDFFKFLEKDKSTRDIDFSILSLTKGEATSVICDIFKQKVSNMADPSMVTRLYYCFSSTDDSLPKKPEEILRSGFSENEFSKGVYGRGLYFSKYPSKAAKFSKFGKMIVAEVGLGNIQPQLIEDENRTSPSPGYDCILMSSDDKDEVIENPDPHFEPIISLPPVQTKTLEEDEEELLKLRAKLFRYDCESEPHEWKERGTGDVKILHHKQHGTCRILMRRDKTFKICANHYILPELELKPNCGSDRAWVWSSPADFADEEPKPELLAIRFANAEHAQKFKEIFDDAKQTMIRRLKSSKGKTNAEEKELKSEVSEKDSVKTASPEEKVTEQLDKLTVKEKEEVEHGEEQIAGDVKK